MTKTTPGDAPACETGENTPRSLRMAYWLPGVLLLIGGSAVGAPLRVWMWAAGAALTGVLCLANARRCGRVHCLVTGPLFTGLALVWLAEAAGVWRPDATLLWNLAMGGTALSFLPEVFGVRYWRRLARRT